ncbi:MAG: hypothetical protein IT270_19120 [Saprospiraceae bacterium]|nr:hypothetical protein [Saprospiraceae bacterium]
MARLLLFLLHVLGAAHLFAQISPEDSIVQVVAYWRLGESQHYMLTTDKYRVEGTDTILRRKVYFDIDVVVTDSSEHSYTMEWRYRRPDLAGIDDRVMVDYMELYKNHKVVVKTDEYGNFLSVENWEEIRDNLQQGIKNLLLTSQTPDHIMFTEIGPNIGTRAAIENAFIKDIRTFYAFFGEVLKLDEYVVRESKIPNLFGGTAFDGELEVELGEIDFAEQTAIFRSWQTADPDQVALAVAEFLEKKAPDLNDKAVTDPGNVPLASIEERSAAKIHCPSGWILYSSFVREANLGHLIDVVEITLELK